MLDFDALAQQHRRADLHAAIRAATIRHIKAQFFPQDPFLDVCCANTLFGDAQDFSNRSPNACVALLVVRLLALRVLLLLTALFQVSRELNHDFARTPITPHQRIDNHSHLVEPNMHRGIGDFSKTSLFRVFRLATAKRHMSLQRAAVIGQLLECENWLDFTGRCNGPFTYLLDVFRLVFKVEPQIAVVRKACGLHCFVISNYIAQ